jgi:aspartyl-tRNA(Asn)/glutamyl-tRNA(Gln) amidotransferase subunit C
MAEINRETIEHIADLAKLYLTDAEKERSEKDMRRMTAYIGKLNEIDVSDIKADAHMNDLSSVFREDTIENKNGREELLDDAPEREGVYIRVPKTV